MDGIYLRRNWGGEFENVAILIAITVNEDGYREVLGAVGGTKEAVGEVFPKPNTSGVPSGFYCNAFSL